MKLVNWVRFTWDFAQCPAFDPRLPQHYRIDPATSENEKDLRQVIASSLRLDPVWNPALREVMQTIDAWLDRAFNSEANLCLALRHGTRIIGASVLSHDPAVESQLMPGPCLMSEYRNRGFGSLLLEHSLKALREAGLVRAHAITRENTPVARFLYPKFNGISEPFDRTPLLAA